MNRYAVLALIVVLVFSVLSIYADQNKNEIVLSKNQTAKMCNSGPAEREEFYRETMSGFYDAIIYPEGNDEKSLYKAAKKTRSEFKKTLAEICVPLNVKFEIISESGPHQINYKQKLSFEVVLSGKNADITEADRLLEEKYRDPPGDRYDY